MHKLFSEINNCYNLRYMEASVKYKKKYIGILNKMDKLNLIKSYKIKNKYIYIYLKYLNNKPLFIFKNYFAASNFKYLKLHYLKRNYTFTNSLKLYTTTLGILTFEEMVLKNSGGKLLVDIQFNGKNVL
uniref:Ribosomal protein small subunit 8 n=1 Tax=Paramoeba pemaquidensis TaxID=180228 RepID=A0A1D8D5E5_9EUKA|nr:ribosomal protein small subunit 8 [Paramoeba pemaquidensis]AOS85532.1 ribosomal protein small subunit 8 [Paramoeba pemaquidensis]